MIGFPLDSQVTYGENGEPIYDRAVSSAPLRALIEKLFSTGIMANINNCFRVVSMGGMNIKVYGGLAIVKGCIKLETADTNFTIPVGGGQKRIDTVVLRLNTNNDVRSLELAIKNGTPATNPSAPALTRNESVYEIGLADLHVNANVTAISQSNINDTRLNSTRCGVISSISQFDTTAIYDQIQADMAEFKAEEQAQFLEWYQTIQNILDQSAAGHLQNEINEVAGNLSALGTRVSTAETKLNGIVDTSFTTTSTDNTKAPSSKLVAEAISATNSRVKSLEDNTASANGTFTANFNGATITGNYYKFGKIVTVHGRLALTAALASGGSLSSTSNNLPYKPNADSIIEWTSAGTNLMCAVSLLASGSMQINNRGSGQWGSGYSSSFSMTYVCK